MKDLTATEVSLNMGHLQYRSFYPTSSGSIGLVISDNSYYNDYNSHEGIAVRYSDNYVVPKYDTCRKYYDDLNTTEISEEQVNRRFSRQNTELLLNYKLLPKVSFIDNRRVLEFPIGVMLDYEYMCRPLASKQAIIQSCPVGYDYSYFVYEKVPHRYKSFTDVGSSFKRSSNYASLENHEFITYLTDNLHPTDFWVSRVIDNKLYSISKRSTEIPDIINEFEGTDVSQSIDATQLLSNILTVGMEIFFNNPEIAKLISILFKDIILVSSRKTPAI